MTMYYEGYEEAKKEILGMSEQDLYDYIGGIFGCDNLPENPTRDELVNEALRQCRLDYTDTQSNEYSLASFYKSLARAWRD
jgi:hypothetical protein